MQVRHVRDALRAEFDGHIDMSDVHNIAESEKDTIFLSRALAARAVRVLSGSATIDAAKSVIDGRDDYGIDAIATADGAPELWLIQAKWSNKGRAGCNTEAANKLVRGFRKLDNHEFEKFNDRFQVLAPAVSSILLDPRCKVNLVVALMGNDELSGEVLEIFDDAAAEFNVFGRTVSHSVITGADFWASVREDVAPQPISVAATMSNGWHSRDTPFEAHYGLVSVEELAGWYSEHGDRLFARNVRKSLGSTRVNSRLVETLSSEPEKFWYFNNGITVVCQSVDRQFFKTRTPGAPATFTLCDASVVNGAQTVASAHRAMQEGAELLDEAFVSVRIIALDGVDGGFGTEITEATNTQNHMEQRDFISIDEVQSLIREDFQLSLGKEYSFKRGELDPPADQGCSVVHAALALACAHKNPKFAIQSKHDLDSLWRKGRGGAYTVLFGNRPSAHQIWRSVQLMQAVGSQLRQIKEALVGRAAAVANHGDLLIVHLVFQSIDQDGMDDPDSIWDTAKFALPELVEKVLWQLINSINSEFGQSSYISSTFANEDRCLKLVALVLAEMGASDEQPSLDAYKLPARSVEPGRRRPTTVKLLLDEGLIPEGTTLSFITTSSIEREAVSTWLEEDPDRGKATWVANSAKPLRWCVDGVQYSPTGLTTHIWRLAGWADAWVSVQGPKQWAVEGGETLVELADQIWRGAEDRG